MIYILMLIAGGVAGFAFGFIFGDKHGQSEELKRRHDELMNANPKGIKPVNNNIKYGGF